MNGTLYLLGAGAKASQTPRSPPPPTLERDCDGVWGGFVRDTLNKDHLENGLQHSAASVSPLHPLFPPHIRLPQAPLLVFVLILLPESEGEGVRTGGADYVGGLQRGMAMVKTD